MLSYPVQAGATLTRVLEAGSGERTVLLLHGVGARSDRWKPLLALLADAGLHAYAVDFPGHGFATKDPAFDHSVAGYVSFARELLDGIGSGPAVIIGTSLGGHVAAALACEEPEIVRALVLVGSLGLVPLGEPARRRIAASLTDTSEEGVARKLRGVVHDPGLVGADWIAEEARINNSPGAAAVFRRVATYFERDIDRDVVGSRLRAHVGAVPTLLVWGADDTIVPVEVGIAGAELLGGVRLETIAGSGHAPYFEAPEAFSAIACAFLDSVAGAESPDAHSTKESAHA